MMMIAALFPGVVALTLSWLVSGVACAAGASGEGDGQAAGRGRPVVSESVFGAGCRWDPTQSNIEEVTFQFRTGEAPPSSWFVDVHHAAQSAASAPPAPLARRDNPDPPHPGQQPRTPAKPKAPEQPDSEPEDSEPVLDASYHTRLIDVLTYRARFGTFGSSLNSAGCALPAVSERLAEMQNEERKIVNDYARQHLPAAGVDDSPNAMFFWAGLSNYDPAVRSDLIQTVVFYGDGCAADPRAGLCVYAAEYSNFRYSAADHMCMGSNMPIFYPVNSVMTVVYRTQHGFRTQESWIDNKMVSYLRSAGDQLMNSFVITQECKNCTWPISAQVYSNILLRFTHPEPHFDKLGLCTGGARLKNPPRMIDGGKAWFIDEVWVPASRQASVQGDQHNPQGDGKQDKAKDGKPGMGKDAGTPSGQPGQEGSAASDDKSSEKRDEGGKKPGDDGGNNESGDGKRKPPSEQAQPAKHAQGSDQANAPK